MKNLLFFFILGLCCVSCDKQTPIDSATNGFIKDTVTVIPVNNHFISTDYIELDKIERISKFRSGIGHDYRDDAESCRSMKHYYQPKNSVDWSAIKIFSPIHGTIVRIIEEWAGTQLWIQPNDQPSYTIIIFHINMNKPLIVGDSVDRGQQLGTHIGSQTYSDIAVGFTLQNRWRLVSYFDVISDSLFQRYSARGILSRSDCIISKSARDADPLNCSGETFGTGGRIENWIVLN
jgi:hypothetical protein